MRTFINVVKYLIYNGKVSQLVNFQFLTRAVISSKIFYCVQSKIHIKIPVFLFGLRFQNLSAIHVIGTGP